MILNDAEIEAKMQVYINDQWPPALRENAIRIGGAQLADLNAFFAECSLIKADMVAQRDKEVAVAAYISALRRLSLQALTVSDEVSQEQVDADMAERASAQEVIDSAGVDVLAMVAP